ncbi:hypothetical protein AB0K00_11855 [Dactylosporangium sp. NPDC049525]|uniref:hypothetical protein n=1 Tax=Dactylosporangium sp. NPDC049525 TaxID=3154730 RepID=UPI00343008DC
MASQGYRDWLNAGRPYTLIRPAKAVQATLRGYGLTVYDYPNDAHLQANTPEDHTPFSVTGWPGPNKRWKARALDIMPRSDSSAHRKENADIARQLIKDRDAGHPGAMWIKYLNWTDEKGNCNQERWTDSANPLRRTTRSSSDRGHVHISGRSDVDDDDRADEYDPIGRLQGRDYSVADSQLIANSERGVTALVAGTDPIQFEFPWNDQAAQGFPNPLNQMTAKLDRLIAAAAADETRDLAATAAINSLVAAIQGGGALLEAEPIIAAIEAVRAQTHAEVVRLQEQLAAAEAQNQALAAALKEATSGRQPDSQTAE